MPVSHETEHGYRLGTWVSHQRYTKDYLETTFPGRYKRLNDLPGWSWNPQNDQWEKGFQCLLVYVLREDDALVPERHIEGNYNLGSWVWSQRQQKSNGTLSDERVERLDDLAGWAWSAIEAKWEEGFRYLRAFVQRETHALVKYTHMEDGYPLGQWVVRQRARKKRHYLKEHDPKRYKRLSKLAGWAWNANEAGWEEGFRCLRAYVDAGGNAGAPPDEYDGYRLRQWVQVQRKDRAKLQRNHRSRFERLDKLPGWLWKVEKGQRRGTGKPRKPLTIDQIVEWGKAHMDRTGKRPSQDSGRVIGGPPGLTWRAIYQRFRKGRVDGAKERRMTAFFDEHGLT